MNRRRRFTSEAMSFLEKKGRMVRKTQEVAESGDTVEYFSFL